MNTCKGKREEIVETSSSNVSRFIVDTHQSYNREERTEIWYKVYHRYRLLFSESVASKTKNISGRTLQSIASEMIFAVYESPDVLEKTQRIYESVFMHCL